MTITKKFPSAKELVEEAAKLVSGFDINDLHSATYGVMKKYLNEYYKMKVKGFLSRPEIKKSLDPKMELLLTKEMLKPLIIRDKNGEKIYNNFMEEASRRISQTFQVISGNIAELCVEKEVRRQGLKQGLHYLKKNKRSDLTFYHSQVNKPKRNHRVEIKNVKLRERAVRGLSFDGDSLLGFFNDPSEFTRNTIDIFDEYCTQSGGYCYVPKEIISAISSKLTAKRFKPNTEFAKDMVKFVKTGVI